MSNQSVQSGAVPELIGEADAAGWQPPLKPRCGRCHQELSGSESSHIYDCLTALYSRVQGLEAKIDATISRARETEDSFLDRLSELERRVGNANG
jgi:hypothetical protein